MQITLITVGGLKESYLREACGEYRARLTPLCSFEEINLKEERIADETDPSAVAAALEHEGGQILSRVPKGCPLVALCVEGRELSSEEFAETVGRFGDGAGKVCFAIGSSHGLSPAVKAKADLKLSYSKMTLPHQLMRVFFLESIYRALSILRGNKYHK